MYITFTKKNILLWGSMLCIFFAYKLFSLPIVSSILPELTYVGWMSTFFLAMYLYKDIIRFNNNNRYLKFLFIYIGSSQAIISVYSMMKYNQTILDMIICIGPYLHLLFVYILLVGMEEFGSREFFNRFFKFAKVYMLFLLLNAVLVNNFGIRLMTEHLNSKTSFMRAYAGPLYVVFMIFLFWEILCGKRTHKNIIWFLLGIVVEFYIQQTRTYQLSLFMAFFFMWFFHPKKDSKKLLQIVVVFIFIFVFFRFGYYRELIDSFSIDFSVNKQAASSLARVNAVKYYYNYFVNNPIMGMGWIRPKNDFYRSIISGPDGTAFFDDLGFLGQALRQGILGALIYIIILLRLIYMLRIIDKESQNRTIILGILIFIIVSSISLNCLDGQRILGTAFFIALSEKIFGLEKKEMTL